MHSHTAHLVKSDLELKEGWIEVSEVKFCPKHGVLRLLKIKSIESSFEYPTTCSPSPFACSLGFPNLTCPSQTCPSRKDSSIHLRNPKAAETSLTQSLPTCHIQSISKSDPFLPDSPLSPSSKPHHLFSAIDFQLSLFSYTCSHLHSLQSSQSNLLKT